MHNWHIYVGLGLVGYGALVLLMSFALFTRALADLSLLRLLRALTGDPERYDERRRQGAGVVMILIGLIVLFTTSHGSTR